MNRLSKTEFKQLYDHDYFAGISSGYPESGYDQSHPDWGPWLDLIRRIQPNGTLVDLGCAFGYLVAEARQRGYQAFGLDISPYAVSREPGITGLVEADTQTLPLRSSSVDIAALFDVLEHLSQPRLALAEVARILGPEGLLIGATPDPIFFSRREPTHVFERPPSYWIESLRRLGFESRFRFSEEAYNFQFVATPAGSRLSSKLNVLQHDYFSSDPDILQIRGPLLAVPRCGWGTLREERRRIRERSSVYLLNPSPAPLHAEVSCRILNRGSCVTLRIGFNSLILDERVLTPEQPAQQHLALPSLELPAGGHHLWFELQPASSEVALGDVLIESSEGNPHQLVQSLPFDLFQRYQLASQICALLGPSQVLDVGGYLGDEGGHLATVQDFLAGARPLSSFDKICSTDLRQGDWPTHQPAPAAAQPYKDGAFDLVLALDVLEHLPARDRTGFLEELDRLSRRWIVVAAPFASAEVEEVEESLRDGLLSSQRFLREHGELGLPRLASVVEHYREQGYVVEALPNGFLPRWRVMQILTRLYFGHHDWVSFRTLNQLYNRWVFPQDQLEPAYRHHLLISKEPLSAGAAAGLAGLRTDPDDASPGDLAFLNHADFALLNERILERLDQTARDLHDTQFLFGERQKLIGLLEDDLETTRKELARLRRVPLYRLALQRVRRRLHSLRKADRSKAQ